jgi:hypothetical protein
MKIYHLTIPHHNARDPEFQCWVDSIGDSAGPEVSLSMLHRVENFEDILNFVYPAHILVDPLRCIKCSILAPTHRQVNQYNDTILKQIYGPQRTYMASDSLKEITAAGMVLPSSVLDYAAKQTPPGLPPHTLHFKIGGIYSVLRDLETPRDLDTPIGKFVQIPTDLCLVFYIESNRYHLSYVDFWSSLGLWPLCMILKKVQF